MTLGNVCLEMSEKLGQAGGGGEGMPISVDLPYGTKAKKGFFSKGPSVDPSDPEAADIF